MTSSSSQTPLAYIRARQHLPDEIFLSALNNLPISVLTTLVVAQPSAVQKSLVSQLKRAKKRGLENENEDSNTPQNKRTLAGNKTLLVKKFLKENVPLNAVECSFPIYYSEDVSINKKFQLVREVKINLALMTQQSAKNLEYSFVVAQNLCHIQDISKKNHESKVNLATQLLIFRRTSFLLFF